MTSSYLKTVLAGVIVTLAVSAPVSAQGKGKSGKSQGKTPAPPPSTSALPTPTTVGGETATATPFAWIDDANLMAPGAVWLGISMVRWQGSGTGETIVPVIDGAIGLTPRVQIGASVSRVAGSIGTTFFSAKIAVLDDVEQGWKLAVAPTLEVLSRSAMFSGPSGLNRAQWGLPVSFEVDREIGRIYGSSGYFSPGIWYAGAGFGKPIGDRAGISLSFSRAWATSPANALNTVPGRNELSGGGSFDLKPNISLFGSLGRTLGLAADAGAGTTISFGLSLSAGPAAVE